MELLSLFDLLHRRALVPGGGQGILVARWHRRFSAPAPVLWVPDWEGTAGRRLAGRRWGRRRKPPISTIF